MTCQKCPRLGSFDNYILVQDTPALSNVHLNIICLLDWRAVERADINALKFRTYVEQISFSKRREYPSYSTKKPYAVNPTHKDTFLKVIQGLQHLLNSF